VSRTTFTWDEETRRRFHGIATERGISMAALIRSAIDEAIERPVPTPRSPGIGASGTPDTGRITVEVRPEPRAGR
jgi:hypothetical protein